MKILRLDLRAFGPFTDVTLELEAGEHGLHVIYGPNEAGKSATLRALAHFFYGIPERTTDDFQHRYDKLRVGARVRHSDGAVLECIRRKARVNALRGPDDKAVVDPVELARLLAGVEESSFAKEFGIDHERLVQASQDMLKSDGQLGRTLFQAGAGIENLPAVQDALQAELDELFRPAGRTQRINKAVAELYKTQAALKRPQVRAEDWAQHDRDLRAAEQQKQQEETQRLQKSRELHHLTRVRDALPAIAKRKELLAEWAGLREVVLLPPDFPEKRQGALETLRVAEDQARQAQDALEQIDQALQQLDVPEALLEQADRIEDLNRRLGEYQKGMRDRPIRVVQGKSLEHDAKEILRSLRRPAELDQAEHLRLSVDEPLKIQNLGTRQQGLDSRCDGARQARDDLVRRIEQAQQDLARLAAPPDPAELRRLIRAVQNEGPLEEQWVAEEHKARQAEKQLTIDLARLPLWSGAPEELERLALPATETIDRFESDLSQLQSTRQQQNIRAGELETELRELEGRIEQMEREQAVPSEDDLQEVRGLRDAGWRLVRRAWLEHIPEAPGTADFLAQFSPAANLAEAYERSVEGADLIADRLRREANRVAGKAKLVADHGQRRDQLDQLNNQLGETRERITHVEGQWTALWRPLAIQHLPPREMRTWVRKQGELARQVQALRQQREQAARLQERIQTHRRQLGACLQKLREPDADPDETLVSVVERSQEVIDRFDRLKQEGERLEREIAGHTQELPGAQARLRLAETELVRWQQQWAAAMARLGLEADASPSQAIAVLAAITTLFQKLRDADNFRRRIEGMDRDAAQFRADVQDMVQRTAPDVASLDVEPGAQELHSRLQRARAAHQDRQSLLRQRGQESGKIRKAGVALGETRGLLEAMCREAGCATHEELPRSEQRSARRRQLERDIRQCEEHLLTLSAGAALDEFIVDAARVDVDGINPALQELDKQTGDLERTISRLDQTIGSERALLVGMNDNAAAADAAETAQNLLAQLHTDVKQYVTLRLAAWVLKEAIESYRKKNQDAVLTRAGRLFADLTVGSFEGLQIDYDDAGQQIIVGVRGGGREVVRVHEGMSDGSRDQLYLALRIASLEAYLDSHEPIPFIVDDILLNFDNDRAAAALKCLAELSRRTQVIFFTHHEHLVELAEKCLEKGVLFIHRLPEGTAKVG